MFLKTTRLKLAPRIFVPLFSRVVFVRAGNAFGATKSSAINPIHRGFYGLHSSDGHRQSQAVSFRCVLSAVAMFRDERFESRRQSDRGILTRCHDGGGRGNTRPSTQTSRTFDFFKCPSEVDDNTKNREIRVFCPGTPVNYIGDVFAAFYIS